MRSQSRKFTRCHGNGRAIFRSGLVVALAWGCVGETPTSIGDGYPLQGPATKSGMEESMGRQAEVGRSAPPQTRPMKMHLAVELGDPVQTPLPECLVAHVSSVITGHATHLGEVRGVGSTCIQTLQPDANPPFLPPGQPPYATAQFTNPSWVLTAANGDELWLEATGIAVLGVNPADGSFASLAARGTHRITGGTGRFEGATGELETRAVNEDAQGPDDVRSEGWIQY